MSENPPIPKIPSMEGGRGGLKRLYLENLSNC
jgi:hypothetical protein